jgi:hypothetical protein
MPFAPCANNATFRARKIDVGKGPFTSLGNEALRLAEDEHHRATDEKGVRGAPFGPLTAAVGSDSATPHASTGMF